MFGFGKKKGSEQPTPPDDDPPGEAEKVLKIKHLCWLAGMSAENIIGLSEEQLQEENSRYEYDRYKKKMLEATNLARELTNVFYRDAALHLLIKPLVAAGDEAQAKKLFAIIEVDIIQDAVLKDFPRLGAKF